MKCNHCNAEVADGTNFCPNCGNRIEQPQPQKCSQCNTEVAAGTKFCPNCGSPIEIKPIVCSKCGTEIEEGEKFCTNCGTPVSEQSTTPVMHFSNPTGKNNKEAVVNLKWKGGGKMSLWSNPIKLIVDGKQYGDFKHKDPFEISVPITSSQMKIQLKYLYVTTEFELNLDPKQCYDCNLQFSGDCMASGAIAYELRDSKNNFLIADGNVQLIAQIFFLIVPLAGFIYFFMKKSTEPLCAKVGLIWGLVNIVWTIFNYFFLLN